MNRRSLQPLLAAFLVAASALTAGCEEDDPAESFAPYDCLEIAPKTGRLAVEVTINAENSEVPLTVYRGNWEDNVVELVDTLKVAEWSREMPVDVRFSATATYKVGESTVIALDDGFVDLKFTDYKDARCWEVDDASLNLKLKAMK